MKSLFYTFLFLSVCVESKLEDHFKSAPNKSNAHQMRNIDFIYTINLDQRPEKFAKCNEQLNPHGIYPYRFSAVNGWELTLEAITDVGLKYKPEMEGGFWATSYLPDRDFEPFHERIKTVGRTYFCHCMARGTIGIMLSHLSVLQDAYDAGFETVWVMEDDVEVIRDPNLLSDLIEQLDKKVGQWDILFTDQDIRGADGKYIPCYGMARRPNFNPKVQAQYNTRKLIDKNFRKIGARFGAHSYILRRSGIKMILDFVKEYEVFFPYDMDFYLPIGIKMYSVIDDVVTNQLHAISDNGGANYLK